jgi:TetR/AcrR family transcriptional regulator, mexJK operon transcriptional repressor
MDNKMQETGKPGKDDRRANIIQIAREVFLREGYAATSMSKIAAMVGGSKATLYSYFPSKKDLFFAVVEAESGEVLDDLYQIDEGCTDVREALRAFCRRFVTVILSDMTTAFDRIVTAESIRFPEIGLAAYEFGYKRGLDRMEALMRLGMEAGVLRRVNPRTAAEYLLNLCSGHLHRLRQWNVITEVLPHDLEAQIALTTAAFLALFGNDDLAAEARQLTGL